jgi:hypothetical protein
MELYDTALSYWVICKRFNAHKKTNPIMRPAALRDMNALLETTKSDAVTRRVNSFIAANQRPLRGNGAA